MANLVRSARGDIVDFDLLKIKQQLASTVAPVEVRSRENFIEKRLKRKLKNRATLNDSDSADVDVSSIEGKGND